MPADFFVILVIAAMSAFAVVLGFVSISDRDPKDLTPGDLTPAE